MPFDPAQPAASSPLSSQVMREQLTALKALIDNAPPGPPGPPGEVSAQQLADAVTAGLGNSSANSNAVATLALAPSDPPTAADFIALQDKINELIQALRR